MGSAPAETDFYRALIAIETDATRYYGPHARRPGILEQSQAEQLLAHIAADLQNLIPEISGCSLIAAGALFDQTQVLRPAYPALTALESVAMNRNTDRFRPRLVSIGASEGKMPQKELQPYKDTPLGLLQLLPVVVQGPAELVQEIGQQMEYRFLEEGQVSAHSAQWMASAFDIKLTHARFMTLTDLNAMLRLQLEHFGFLPLWELLDAALNGHDDTVSVMTESGSTLAWEGDHVKMSFETFDYWANKGVGSKVPANRQRLSAGYGEWTRETRQYLTTLNAHGLKVRFYLPGESTPLSESYYCQHSPKQARSSNTTLTEHSYSELGTVVVTRVDGERIEHYYPLTPGGLNDIQSYLRDQVPHGHTVAFPGSILYDEAARLLIPDSGWK